METERIEVSGGYEVGRNGELLFNGYRACFGQVSRGSAGNIRQMTRQVSRGSAGEYQADERAGVAGLSWRVSGR